MELYVGQLTKPSPITRRALSGSTQRLTSRSLAAGVLEGKREYDRAIADCTEAIQLNPQSAKAFNNRGSAWTREG